MSNFSQFQKTAFTSGEQAPRLEGRSDLESYDLGIAEAENWFVDFLGPAMTRPGTQLVDFIQDEGEPCRLSRFQFNANIGNTYVLVWSKNRLRFVQDGAYVLEAPVAFSVITPTTLFTSAPHGYSVNDAVVVLGRSYIVAAVTSNTLLLHDAFGEVMDFTPLSPPEVARIYTLASPYATEDLRELIFDQFLDTIYITHRNYPPRKLIRNGATNWTSSVTYANGYAAAVTSLTATPSSAGTAGMVYAVVPVSADGVEAPLSATCLTRSLASVDFTVTAGYNVLTWAGVANAARYKVYRSLVYSRSASATYGVELGYIGETLGREFTDENIVPDFTRAPLTVTDLLNPGGITSISVTAVGSGYTSDPTVTIGGGGSGASAVTIREGDKINGILLLNAGSGYTSPTVSITGGGGSGATATAIATSTTGSHPSTTGLVQQRRWYGGSTDAPSLLYASRPGEYDNFTLSGLSLDTDPLVYLLAQEEETPIRQLVKSNIGMFVFMRNEVQIVRGIDDSIIVNSGIRADEQNEAGTGFLPVIRINRDYLYLTPTSENVYALIPSNLPNYYQTKNLTYYANHLFTDKNKLVAWTWAEDPYRLIWAPREDGSMLAGTYMADQNVMAWTRHTTQGFFEDALAVKENDVDRTYVIVTRVLKGQRVKLIERLSERDTLSVEDMWAVDCGLENDLTYPAADLSVGAFSGETTVTASASVFSSGDVSKTLRVRDGRAFVVSYTSPTELVVNFRTPISAPLNQSSPPLQLSGTWSLTEPSTTFSGLSHLEGQEVEILADGAYVPNQIVTDGAVTLAQPASKIIVGLPYEAELTTLPLTAPDAIIDGNLKQVLGVGVRMHETRGIAVGTEPDFYEIPLESQLSYDEPAPRLTGYKRQSVRSSLDDEGRMKIKKVGPQHATVLGLVMETSLERNP